MEIKPGSVIAIYEDPITMKKLEGYAVLEKLVHRNRDEEYWTVKFTSDGYRTERWVKTTNRPLLPSDKNKEALDSFFAKNI